MVLFSVIYKYGKTRVFSNHLDDGWKYAGFKGGDVNKKGGRSLL